MTGRGHWRLVRPEHRVSEARYRADGRGRSASKTARWATRLGNCPATPSVCTMDRSLRHLCALPVACITARMRIKREKGRRWKEPLPNSPRAIFLPGRERRRPTFYAETYRGGFAVRDFTAKTAAETNGEPPGTSAGNILSTRGFTPRRKSLRLSVLE